MGKRLVEVGKEIRATERIVGDVGVVLTNVKTGKKRVYRTHNIVTDDGDQYYAQKGASESPWTVAGMRLGSNGGSPSAPTKSDVKMQTTTGSTPIASSVQAIDGGYPKTNDDDTDNPGTVDVDVVTWRRSYTTAQANDANIATLDLPDNLTDGSITKSLCIANFAAKFAKTSSDTLKVYVNHTFNGT